MINFAVENMIIHPQNTMTMENNENTTYGNADKLNEEQKEKNVHGWQSVTIGGVTGILLGAGGMLAANAFAGNETKAPENEDGEADTNPNTDTNTATEAETGGVAVADISQGLSFSEALAAARAAVGPGGAFVWHGGVYGTYYADEWNNMTPAERAQFTHQAMSEVQPTHNYTPQAPHEDVAQHHQTHVSQKHDEPSDDKQEHESHHEEQEVVDEPEVHFLGVERVETDNGPWNVGHMIHGDQEVALVDLDNDLVFDVAVSDINHNEQIDDNEIHDISDRGITVTDFALASMQQDNGDSPYQTAHGDSGQDQIADDMPDYMPDADVQTI